MEGFIKMIWEEVEKKYGKELANKISKSKYLQGITVELTKNGEVDIPEGDIVLAHKDIMGKPIYYEEWD